MSTTEDTGAEVDDEVVEPDPDAVSITVNGRSVTARRGDLVIAAAERAGDYIPRFCYHPRMSSVGMCRQCLVEIDTGRGPMLQPSCMVTVSEGMVVDTESETTKRAQEGILELLLANHPLDCPVCDKGGECPLQDQAFSHGPGESRYVEEKRHYEKPIPISDLVYLDRERCILCDRCTRFADEVAGDALIHFIDRGNATQVNTFPDEPFSSYFSGNTVQICPVGALTAKPYRFKARPWDLEQVESTCTSCSVGCRISVHSSRDRLLRFQGVDDEAVNWGWLCDRGRFNFESVHADRRLAEPLIRSAEGLVPTDWSSALSITADLIRSAVDGGGPGSVAVLGGARGTNEDALAWSALADALGVESRDARLGDGLGLDLLDLPRATIADLASASTVVLMAPDLKEELPVLHLRLRDAALRSGTRVIEFTQSGSGLTRHAWRSIRHLPGTGAAAVAEALASIRQADLPPALAAQVYVCRQPTETPTGKYLGTCHFQRLLREPPSTLISSLLDTSVDPVRPDTPLADVTRDFAAYNLVAVPVVDEDNHLVGAVTIDDVVDHMLPANWREQVGPDRVETTASTNDGPSTPGASDG